MKVKRTVIEETNEFMVGDVIGFELSDGEKVEAMAVRKESDGMVFIFIDCLADEYTMNDEYTNKGGYEASDLRKKLNGKILERFPERIKNQLVPFTTNEKGIISPSKTFLGGDFLRLATEKEIFGENHYGTEEPEYVEQFEPMKQRRNRIAFQGHNGDWEWWWLQNTVDGSATSFAYVNSVGNTNDGCAAFSFGVRPCFKL